MGQEAQILCHHEGLCFEVKALLETFELIIRGPLKLRAPFNEIKSLQIRNDCLEFVFDGDEYALELGKDCQKWLRKITAPPKSISEKMGLRTGDFVLQLNVLSSEKLKLALAGALAASNETAKFAIIEIATLKDLLDLEAQLSQIHLPIWIINQKGKSAKIGENMVREFMRNNGFIDSKTCGIDENWSSTRYGRVT